MTIKPRPGSGIYRRTDDGHTGLVHQESGAGYLEGYPGVTAEERLAAEEQQPGFHKIWDGNAPADHAGGFEIEHYHSDTLTGHLVILAPSRPPFGEWEQLDEWPE